MIQIHLFKSWDEALKSKFGPMIKHWPNTKPFKGQQIQNVMIMVSGKKFVSAATVERMSLKHWGMYIMEGLDAMLKAKPTSL